MLVSDYAQRRPMVIAVMPVSNDTGGRLQVPSTGGPLQAMFSKLLSDRQGTDKADVLNAFRVTVSAKLSEKGYQHPPRRILEAGLTNLTRQDTLKPQQLKDVMQSDAILTSSLTVWDTQYWRSQHAIVVGIQFTLVDIATNETLWQGKQEKKSVAIRDLQKSKDVLFYVEKVVNQVFSTLP